MTAPEGISWNEYRQEKPTTKDTKAKVTSLLGDLQKQFGDNLVMRASEAKVGPPISSGSLALDFALGFGGFPSNRVAEIYGRPGTGKTTLALLAMANGLWQNPQRGAIFMDMEHKITDDWLRQLVGDDIVDHRLIYIRPTSIEQATNIYRQAAESGGVCFAILDSIGGASSIRDGDDAERQTYGGNAMGVGKFARAAGALSDVYDCCTIGINQVRANMSPRGFMDDTPGGLQWKHTVTQRVELVKGGDIETVKLPGEDKPYPIGYNVFAKVRKNGVGAPGRTAMYWFYNVWSEEFGFGVDQMDEVARLGLMTGVFKKTGSWYHHPGFPEYKDSGDHKIQGMPAVKDLVKSDRDLYNTLRTQILGALKDHGGEVAPIGDPEEPSDQVGSMMTSGTA